VGLEGLKAAPPVLDTAAFSRAESEFAEVRALDPAETASALGYEVVCRLGRGWCAVQAGDLAAARREFLSMDELFPRGVEWSVPGELESGIQGLFRVADAYGSKEDLLSAGEVFETLHQRQPDVALWANNAGFFLRDAAVELEGDGRDLCDAARGAAAPANAAELRALAGVTRERPGSPEERSAFVAAAESRFERAHELVERSFHAYERAAELAPDDVRIVNDEALMLVYYLQRDIDRAEAILQRCIDMGAEQVRAKKAELAAAAPEARAELETQLLDLESAWGDAHENMGVLCYTYRKDPARALPFLQRALEIGPDRPSVVNALIPIVRGELVLEKGDTWDLLSWGRPCDPH
jgi:tetratricopeptide (TPR) repeat protein